MLSSRLSGRLRRDARLSFERAPPRGAALRFSWLVNGSNPDVVLTSRLPAVAAPAQRNGDAKLGSTLSLPRNRPTPNSGSADRVGVI